MAAANLTGVVIVGMLIPSLDRRRFKNRIYWYWSVFSVLGGIIAGIWGWQSWNYKEQWFTGLLNVILWGYLVIYMIRERKDLHVWEKIKNPLFMIAAGMLLIMFFSVHEGIAPLWLLLLFGGFYLIGVHGKDREDFFQGMLNGMILWFFIQQIVAFGFRPYDFFRYRGLYSGETQNGLFYMIAYCAFMLKWIWLKENRKSKVLTWLCFLLSAGCVSFIFYTGGRAPLLGAGIASIVIYIWYDIVYQKTFYRLVGHCFLFMLCVMLTFPAVYGCIRYLPVILHHPIWFEGEYMEDRSV
ncbi:MAG: hypothetical protein NC124_19020, partial [Clostridium sp.]|nr:hypothetical protein [Clostridium sp.]